MRGLDKWGALAARDETADWTAGYLRYKNKRIFWIFCSPDNHPAIYFNIAISKE